MSPKIEQKKARNVFPNQDIIPKFSLPSNLHQAFVRIIAGEIIFAHDEPQGM